MKASDIIHPSEKINKLVNFIMARTHEPNNKIVVTGEELLEKYDYDFIQPKLIITIDYNITPSISQDFKVDMFWGDEFRIDIAASGIQKNRMKGILREAMKEYIEINNSGIGKFDVL